jgi:hypothetical protein
MSQCTLSTIVKKFLKIYKKTPQKTKEKIFCLLLSWGVCSILTNDICVL